MTTPTAPSQGRARPPRLFVSYAHENAEHKEQVLRLSSLLVQNGVDVRLDLWTTVRRRDWQTWATQEIIRVDFIAVIASPTCRDVGDGIIHPGRNAGLHAEMRSLREFYCRAPEVWIPRILPVILPGHTLDEIPLFLQPATADHYAVEDLSVAGTTDLLQAIFGVATRRRPPLGPAPWESWDRGVDA
jgi:SEFIR domain